MTQTHAAERLGVNPWTVLNWEKHHTGPPIESMPAIIRFLGYDPFPEPKNITEGLLAKRRVMGWSIREAARQLGVDEGTWGLGRGVARSCIAITGSGLLGSSAYQTAMRCCNSVDQRSIPISAGTNLARPIVVTSNALESAFRRSQPRSMNRSSIVTASGPAK